MNDGSKAISLIDNASQALAEATTFQEVTHLIGMAAAAKVYAKQVKSSQGVIDQATELKIRGERRLGEMLGATELSKGALKKGQNPAIQAENPGVRLVDIGISKKESSQAQRLASIPSEAFEEIIATAKAGALSTARVLKAHEGVGDRRKDGIDFYPTPEWCVQRMLEACGVTGGLWLEPAVGDGSIVRAVSKVRDDVSWTTVDIRPECKADKTGDFLHMGFGERFNAIITNPPYSQALEFVKMAVTRADVVVMLLRLNWLASAERCSWLRANMPSEVYVLPDRPSFDGENTDATDYAWFAWRRGSREQHARLMILETTPLKDRRGGQ